jgi:hypothetical protein
MNTDENALGLLRFICVHLIFICGKSEFISE